MLQLRAILRDDDWERGDGSGQTDSNNNGNERGAVACMCRAGLWGKVRRGIEQDRATEEGTAPSAPARASAHSRRVLDSTCVAPYLSRELTAVLFVCVSGGTYSSVQSLLREEFKSVFRLYDTIGDVELDCLMIRSVHSWKLFFSVVYNTSCWPFGSFPIIHFSSVPKS